jgi:hypothetical protein
MRFTRFIFAVLIGLSVGTLPVTGFAARKQATHDTMHAHDMKQMSAAEPMDDCCPHGTDPCGMATDGCKSMAACTLKCFNFTGGVVSPFLYSNLPTFFANRYDQVDHNGWSGAPPLRPPQI